MIQVRKSMRRVLKVRFRKDCSKVRLFLHHDASPFVHCFLAGFSRVMCSSRPEEAIISKIGRVSEISARSFEHNGVRLRYNE